MVCPKCNIKNSNEDLNCTNCGSVLSHGDEFDSSSGMRTSMVIESTGSGLKKGTLFAGRYEILEAGVKGGMGMVYKVKDNTLGKVKALKIVLPEYLGNEKTISRFKQEVAITQELLHENIVRVYDIGQAEGSIYFTMEWIDGVSLRDYINDRKKQNKRFTLDEILNFGKQICTALSYAHKTVIHRDIKPENILVIDPLSQYPKIKITDFGIAKTDSQTVHVSVSSYMGTPIYMAPEQYTDAAHVDKRADIYSVGVVLYELMTFLHPLGTFPMPCEANPCLPKQADTVIRKALSSDKTKRYEDAMDLIKELETTIVEEKPVPIHLTPATTGSTIEKQGVRVERPIIIQASAPLAPERPNELKTSKKNSMPLVAGAIVVVMLVGGIFFYSSTNKTKIEESQRELIQKEERIKEEAKRAEDATRKAEAERQKAEAARADTARQVVAREAAEREAAAREAAAREAAAREATAREAAAKAAAGREADRQAVSQYLQDGKRYYDLGKYELSIEKMKEVLRRDRNNYEANRYVQMAQERLDQIEREFRNPNVGRAR